MTDIVIVTQNILRKDKKDVDRAVKATLADMGHENVLTETPLRIIQQLLKLYRGGGRLILVVFLKLPVFPAPWKTLVQYLVDYLDRLADPEVIGEIAGKFKAGKDL